MRALRRAAGLTQQALADRAGVSVGTIRDLEQGRTRRLHAISRERLAQVLRGPDPSAAERDGGPPAEVYIAVLGPLLAYRHGAPVALGGVAQRTVLGLLAVSAGGALRRDSIAGTLWPDVPPATGITVIQSYVSRLRRLLDPERTPRSRDGLLASDGTSYRLRIASDQLDLLAFRRLAERARQERAEREPGTACRLYEQGLSLWRGEPLADVYPLHDRPEVVGLSRERAEAVIEYAETASAAGWHERVLPHLYALIEREPLNERAHACLMIALAGSGQQAAALRTYQDVRRQLAEELGLDAGPELADAHLRVLRRQVPSGSELANHAEAIAPTAAGSAGPGRPALPQIVPRHLPAVMRHFAGRSAELAALTSLLEQDAEGGVTVISGTPGVGKTTLAVYWAHQVAERYPDGQLYVNLRGFAPSGEPADPAVVFRGFLHALGVPAEGIPASPEAQAGLYRSLLAGKRMLVVLDNARDAAQVRPLLPGSPGCRVVVTSRSQLTGLAATEDARLLILDVLPGGEASELMAGRLGPERVLAEREAVRELVRSCAGLPLALAIAAARAAARPRFPLAALAAELRDAGGRLDALDDVDAAGSVRTVFSWSYHQLSPAAARLFRLLGLHPGPDISAPAAASLAGLSARQARGLLRELTSAHLLGEPAPGRYACHDLLRAYAAEQARADEGDSGRKDAIDRMLDHYLHTAHAAALLVSRLRGPVTVTPPLPGVTPEQLTCRTEVLAWFDAEQHVLLAATALAAEAGFDRHAWQLPWVMWFFLEWRGLWHEQAAAQRTALAAATRLGDTTGQAAAHRALGNAFKYLAAYDEARGHLTASLELYRQLESPAGEAHIHNDLSELAGCLDRHADALDHLEQALSLFQAAGDRAGQAAVLNNMGWYHAQLGDYQRSRTLCRQALGMQRELGHHHGEAISWDCLGYAEHQLGEFATATECYQWALSMYRELGDRYHEADALNRLGDTYHAAGDTGAATSVWREAMAIFHDLRHPDAGKIRAKLSPDRPEDHAQGP